MDRRALAEGPSWDSWQCAWNSVANSTLREPGLAEADDERS